MGEWCTKNKIDSPTALVENWDGFMACMGIDPKRDKALASRLGHMSRKWLQDVNKHHHEEPLVAPHVNKHHHEEPLVAPHAQEHLPQTAEEVSGASPDTESPEPLQRVSRAAPGSLQTENFQSGSGASSAESESGLQRPGTPPEPIEETVATEPEKLSPTSPKGKEKKGAKKASKEPTKGKKT